ncbi:uncharacterized protein LOC117711986 [Arvicanthis niloticus]|uniref:uncharacterized protein LOC117711986 n=1 Tax=Arvicanthis niloticus TaxID=61156 RepID=UPI00402B8692
MMSPQVLISGLLLLLPAAVDSFPEVHGVVGQPVTLPCTYPVSNGLASMCWGRGKCASDTCGQTLVWTDGNRVHYRTSSRYQINAQLLQGNASLTIEDAYESDSGLYCCRVEMKGWDGVQTLTTSLQVRPGVPRNSSRRLTISSRFKLINRPGPTLKRPETITKPTPTPRRPSATTRSITTPRRPTITSRRPKPITTPNTPRRPTPLLKPALTPSIPSTTTKSTTITRLSTTIKPTTTPERLPRTINPTTTQRTLLKTIKPTAIPRTLSTILKFTTTPRKPATTITTSTTSWKPETTTKLITTSRRPTTTTKYTLASIGPTDSPKSTKISAATSPTSMTHTQTQKPVWTATVTSSNHPRNNHTEVVPTETPLKIPIRGLFIGISVSVLLLILLSVPTIIQCRPRKKKSLESNSECSSVFFHVYQNEAFQSTVQLQAEDSFHPGIKPQLPSEMTTFQSCRRK